MSAQLFEVSIRIIERYDNKCLIVYANLRYLVNASDVRNDKDGLFILLEKLNRYTLYN